MAAERRQHAAIEERGRVGGRPAVAVEQGAGRRLRARRDVVLDLPAGQGGRGHVEDQRVAVGRGDAEREWVGAEAGFAGAIRGDVGLVEAGIAEEKDDTCASRALRPFAQPARVRDVDRAAGGDAVRASPGDELVGEQCGGGVAVPAVRVYQHDRSVGGTTGQWPHLGAARRVQRSAVDALGIIGQADDPVGGVTGQVGGDEPAGDRLRDVRR